MTGGSRTSKDRFFGLIRRELRRATAGGRAGETVPIEVLHDGEILRLFVPRGPLGARVDHERISPTAGD